MSMPSSRWKLPRFLVIFVALQGWVWVTDRKLPGFPEGELGPVVLCVALVVGIVAGLVGLWRLLRPGSHDEPSPEHHPYFEAITASSTFVALRS